MIDDPVGILDWAINDTYGNGGGGGGGANDGTTNEESNENAILPSHDDQGNVCGGVGHISRAQLSCAATGGSDATGGGSASMLHLLLFKRLLLLCRLYHHYWIRTIMTQQAACISVCTRHPKWKTVQGCGGRSCSSSFYSTFQSELAAAATAVSDGM